MIRSAVVTFLFFAVLHLAGGARFVGVLSGTLEGGRWGLFLGLLYALSWFAAVILVPVLLLAGVAELIVLHRSKRYTLIACGTASRTSRTGTTAPTVV